MLSSNCCALRSRSDPRAVSDVTFTRAAPEVPPRASAPDQCLNLPPETWAFSHVISVNMGRCHNEQKDTLWFDTVKIP